MKYTPFSIWNTDPVEVEFDAKVFANGAPTEIVEFPNNPEVIIWLHVKDSPLENVWVVLSTLEEPA